ncbi:hypothetical protein ASG67_16675 [Sphingomonas sp. Leaf339]|uniref:TadE/TadG family type IV pilus assembly protein n=1 Tax=Sphingomonas sp. Leaf339 TaxID=1736343 RepID=UPI0006FA90BA|nr:TadE/TadG family type IV pilus assembly protein [Sphingomonas sp. Leaf339]KQU59161.1 hypothetical protein ASG67_16675 [Sphingomonas sp. Leaf339]
MTVPPDPVPSRRHRSARSLAVDTHGAVIIEFGLLAPAFIALLIAVLVMAVTAFAQQCVQTTADTMARRVLIGQTQLAGTNKEAFRQQACATLPSFMKCNQLIVDLQKANTFQDIDTTNLTLTYDSAGNVKDNWAYTPGNAGDVVILRVIYIWPISTGPLGFNISNIGGNQRLLIGTMVFKSETYS